MKKIILCLSLFVLVNICFVTNVMATPPRITDVSGGLGISATVVNAQGHDWEISIQNRSFAGGAWGTISSDRETIHFPGLPPIPKIGKICIHITVFRTILPDIVEIRSGFMIGPFFLFIKKAPCQCDDFIGDHQD